MITKNGDVCYRSKTSKCKKCSMFIDDPYLCWLYNLIPYRIWENCVEYECEHFESILKDQCNSYYVHQNYEDKDRFPEKKFGGIYRFNSNGKIIGKL